MKIQRVKKNNILLSIVVKTYKNHTKMLAIVMFPSISDTTSKMTAICEQKKNKNKHQYIRRNKMKNHLEIPELVELSVKFPHVSNYNGTSCVFFLW